jgi:hypothetical protein
MRIRIQGLKRPKAKNFLTKIAILLFLYLHEERPGFAHLDPYPEAHSQYRIRMNPTKIDADPGGSGCEFTTMPFAGCRTVHLLADDCLSCGS